MRIVHLTFADMGMPHVGGGARYTWEIDRRLALRHQVDVVAWTYPGARPRREGQLAYHYVGFNNGSLYAILSWYLAAPLALRRLPHDLVIEEFVPPFSVCLSPLATRRPVVGHASSLFGTEKAAQYHLPFDRVERFGLRWYRRFIAPSTFAAQRVKRLAPWGTVVTVPHGVPDELLEVPVSDGGYLLYVGRIEAHMKGLDLLLEALSHLRDRGRLGLDFQLLMAGQGPDSSRFAAEVARRGLGRWVRLLGRIDEARKLELLGGARAVLVPSRYETFGISAMEAQATAKPVLAFRVGPLPEVVHPEGGLLAPAFDVPAYAELIERVWTDPALAERLGTQGRVWARGFTWDRAAERYEAALLELAGSPRRAA